MTRLDPLSCDVLIGSILTAAMLFIVFFFITLTSQISDSTHAMVRSKEFTRLHRDYSGEKCVS